MNTLKVILLTSLFAFVGIYTLPAQPSSIKGMQLNKEATQFLLEVGYSFVDLDDKGNLKPKDGYKLLLDKKSGEVMLTKGSAPQRDQYVKYGPGMSFFCSGCEEKVCEVDKTKSVERGVTYAIKYTCTGCYTDDGGVELCSGSLIFRKANYSRTYR